MLFKFILLLIVSMAIQKMLILFLRKKSVFQNIYELSPERHQGKSHTPSFGGVGIVLTLLISMLFFSDFLIKKEPLFLMGLFFAFSAIGFLDDFLSKTKGKNMGLKPRHKFGLQWAMAIFFVGFFSKYMTPLSLMEMAFYSFLMVGFSNATNLTDGLDGLLAGAALMTLFGFFMTFSDISIKIFLLVLMSAISGFYVFNMHPAKIFMGDTGSLGLGAVFVGFSMYLNQPFILLPLGILYIVETLSVILQVISFKWFKKRLFLMSPLHHHFELLGLSEKKILYLFWLIHLLGIVILFWL